MDFPEGVVCGRFQPPHREHVDYILRALELCNYLWIGLVTDVAGPDALESSAAPHRNRLESNPLTFFERIRIMSKILSTLGIHRSRFGFVPFPLDHPKILPDYISTDIPCLISICDGWSNEKKKRLEDHGYKVHVLFSRGPERISGQRIRDLIIENDDSWKEMVPVATAEAIAKLDIRNRLKK